MLFLPPKIPLTQVACWRETGKNYSSSCILNVWGLKSFFFLKSSFLAFKGNRNVGKFQGFLCCDFGALSKSERKRPVKTPASGVRKGFLIKLLTLNYSDFLPGEPKNPQTIQVWSEMGSCRWEPFSSPDPASRSKRA